MKSSRPQWARLSAAAVYLLVYSPALASTLVQQTAMPGDCIPRFAVALPYFGPGPGAALPRVDALKHPFLKITMKEIANALAPPFTASWPSVGPTICS